MKRTTLFSILATAAFGIVMVGPASASTFTWDGSTSNDWRVSANWDLDNDSYPQSGDIAIIANVATPPLIDQQDEAVNELRVQTGAKLTITGKTLTLGGTTTHDIDGDIHLTSSESNSVLKVTGAVTMDITGKIVLEASIAKAVLDLDANVTVQGAGQIKGEDNAAEIQIATDKVLTSTMSTLGIVGKMKIVGETGALTNAGKLDNRGLVHANADGILTLDSNLIVVDTSGDRWKASVNSGAIFAFDGAIACGNLAGNFDLDGCATFRFNATVHTSGSFTTGDGFLDVNPDDASVCFNYSCNPACTTCTQVCEDTSYGNCG